MRNGLRGFRIFLACLALGIAAIAAIGSVREGIQAGLDREGAALLGGDAEIQLTYRFAEEEERRWMASVAQDLSEIVDFRSMAVAADEGQDQRGLTQVKAVDDAYPLFGVLELDPPIDITTALDGSGGYPGAVMDGVLVDRLELSVGSTFRLGRQEFILRAVLMREPDGANGFSLGPRTIVRMADLSSSGLLAPGTLFESAYRLKLPPGTDLDDLQKAADSNIAEGGFRWRDRRNGAPGMAVFVDRLSTFLVLVGLAGLIVGGVGVSAAVRSYLDEKTPVIATLKSSGADSWIIFQVYFIQIATMAVLGIFLGLLMGAAIPFLFAPIMQGALPVPMVVRIFPVPLAQAFVYGVLVAMLFTLWPLSRSARIRVAVLFRNADFEMSGRPGWLAVVLSSLILALLVTTAAMFSGQVKLVVWASVGLFLAFAALIGAGRMLRRFARWIGNGRQSRRNMPLHLALKSIAGPGREGSAIMLSLGLGLCVLASIGQIDANLRDAIDQELPAKAPSFFVLDIQKDQMEPYMDRLENDPGVSRIENAPMLRGVISKINGQPANEVAGDHWVIRGDRGITYAATPLENGPIVSGEWWPENYSGSPQMSFSAVEAAEMGLSLGDTMTINILGRPIRATITSFREVDFSSAGMGFVIVLDPGALAGAPHSFISTVYADQKTEASILRDLTDQHPNITVISVRQAIDRVGGILRAIAAAVTYGALATLATGLIVMIGTAAVGERARIYEAALLKTLGATRRVILGSFILRSFILGSAAGAIAIVVGGFAGWSVMTFVMEIDFRFSLSSALSIVGLGVAISGAASIVFSLRSLNASVASVLRARE